MKYKAYVFVIDQNNQYGVIETSQIEANQPELAVLLFDGQEARIPSSAITLQSNGTYSLPTAFTSMSDTAPPLASQETSDRLVIPIIAEEVHIDKHWVETGRVRITKVAQQEETDIDELLAQEQIEIQRIPMDQLVLEKPQPRYEGDTLIIPRVEEELVIEKRFRLKEEIHVVKHTIEKPLRQPVTLLKEGVHIERVNGDEAT